MRNIGEIIQDNLEMKNMTQSELGERLGLSQKAISKYVTGKSLPSIDTLEKICSILDVNITSCFNLNLINSLPPQNKDEMEVLNYYRLLNRKNKSLVKDQKTNSFQRSSGKNISVCSPSSMTQTVYTCPASSVPTLAV